MLTPQEVAEHAFAKAMFGGYNMTMVDEFLDELTDDYTALYKENTMLKQKMKVLADKVEEYRATEDSMRSALLAAQKEASSMISAAEEKKETLLADAEMEARAKIGALHDEIISEQKRLNAIKAATADFVARTREVCNAQIRQLDSLPDLTPEQIGQTTVEAKAERDAAANIAALSEKIVSAYEQPKAAEPAAEPSSATLVFPTVTAQEAAAPAADVDSSTRAIKLDELKFGRNYKAGEEE